MASKPQSDPFEAIRRCLRNPVIPNIYDAEARAALDQIEGQYEKFGSALSEIRGSLTALATGGIGETEFAEEVQEALSGV